jgi:hypothetical protein
MGLEPRFVPVAGHEGRRTITDYDGWKWCISKSGRRAVVFLGPPDEKGRYTWLAARAAGKEVDLNRPMGDYPNLPTGPQFREIYQYLMANLVATSEAKTTDNIPNIESLFADLNGIMTNKGA